MAHRFHREAFTNSGYSERVNQRNCNQFMVAERDGVGRRLHKDAQDDKNPLAIRST